MTTIEQSDIDSAEDFKTVITNFWDWINLEEDYLLCSWGFYDRSQFKKDCELNQISTNWLKHHISLKHQYTTIKNLKRPLGMGGALKKEKIVLEGTHHRGIDDAKNIAKIFLANYNNWKV